MNQTPTSTVAHVAATATRLLLPAWIGGAALFVVTSVAEQRFHGFDSTIRDQLATVRFPWYYLYCWLTLGTAAATACLSATIKPAQNRRNAIIVALLTCTALIIAVADYTLTYKPLLKLITPPGQERTEDFRTLHDRSRIVNQIHLTIAIAATLAACLPQTSPRPTHPANHK